ncbi:sensor histidine kinase [Streptomyces sp. NPDC059352]|uniref:sensor histidine kinase n=1 Tax=Streptomyces sp. NPDC059352 TaxID=3346810 RepID=UPI0036B718FB
MRLLTQRPAPGDILLAAAVAVPVGAWSLTLLWLAVPRSRLLPFAVAVLIGHGALVWRRVAPALSFAVVTAAGTAQLAGAGGLPLLPSLVVFPIALYAYTVHGGDRSRLVAPAVGATAAVTAGVWAAAGGPERMPVPAAYLIGLLLAVVAVAVSLGAYRRMQLAYMEELLARTARAEADREERARSAVLSERARVSREMHDVIAHSLAVIVSQAQGGRYAARTRPERAAEVLGRIEETGRQALTDMRGLLGVLRSDTSEATGGWDPQPGLAELPALLDRVRATGLTVDHTVSGEPYPMSAAAGLVVHRLVQEALTNTLKHAGRDARARIRFDWSDGALVVEVSDNGHGPGVSDGAGQGLIGMRERMAVVGGTVHTGPAGEDGCGYLVRARLPRQTGGETR